MASYSFICENCHYYTEFEQSIHLELPCICPRCGGYSYHQDYSTCNVILNNRAADCELDKMTVGEAAERNTKRLGGKVDELKHEHTQSRSDGINKLNEGLPPKRKILDTKKFKKPFYRKSKNPLEIKRKDGKVLDCDKYIETGHKVYKTPNV